jgi:hypothetical protein
LYRERKRDLTDRRELLRCHRLREETECLPDSHRRCDDENPRSDDDP